MAIGRAALDERAGALDGEEVAQQGKRRGDGHEHACVDEIDDQMARVSEEKELFRREPAAGHDGFVVRRQVDDRARPASAPRKRSPPRRARKIIFRVFSSSASLAHRLEADGDVTSVAGQIRNDGDLAGACAFGDERGEVARARWMNDGRNVDPREAARQALRVDRRRTVRDDRARARPPAPGRARAKTADREKPRRGRGAKRRARRRG